MSIDSPGLVAITSGRHYEPMPMRVAHRLNARLDFAAALLNRARHPGKRMPPMAAADVDDARRRCQRQQVP